MWAQQAVMFTLGAEIKKEAWILKRCVSVFSRVAKRPHTPRSRELRTLLSGLGLAEDGSGT